MTLFIRADEGKKSKRNNLKLKAKLFIGQLLVLQDSREISAINSINFHNLNLFYMFMWFSCSCVI